MRTDIAKLLLRLCVGGLMLLHGIAKIRHGVEGIKSMVAGAGWWEFIAYGVYAGEVAAPILLIVGFYTRYAAAAVAATMGFAIFLAHRGDLFALGSHGGAAIELPLLFMGAAVAIALIGPGRYALNGR